MTEVLLNYYDKYMPTKYVKRLTSEDFSEDGSLNGDNIPEKTAVFFYTPDSRFSYDFADQLTKFVVENPKYGGYAVDCSGENGTKIKEMSENFGYPINGDWQWPTIMVYINEKPCVKYTGPRTAVDLKKFMDLVDTKVCDIPEGKKSNKKKITILVIVIILLVIILVVYNLKSKNSNEKVIMK